MQLSLAGKIFLICNEGICLNLYLDSVNVRTIGIGITVSEIPNINSLPWDYEISLPECLDLLDKSLYTYEKAVNDVLDVAIMQHQYDALVSLAFNIGTGNVEEHVGGIAGSTVIKRINAGEPASSVSQAIMMWNKPPEIISRRTREAKLYTNGFYGNTKASLIYVDPVTHKEVPSKSKTIDLSVLLQTPVEKTMPIPTPEAQPVPAQPQVTSPLDGIIAWVKEHWLI